MDVGEMLVRMAQHEVSMVGPVQNLDGVSAVVGVGRVDRVRVFFEFVDVRVGVLAGGDHDYSDE